MWLDDMCNGCVDRPYVPRHLLHRSRRYSLCRDSDRGNIFVRLSIPNTGFNSPLSSSRQEDDPEVVGECLTAQGHIVCLHRLEGCQTGASIEISPHPQRCDESAAPGDFPAHNFRYGPEPRAPSYHSTPPCQSRFQERKTRQGRANAQYFKSPTTQTNDCIHRNLEVGSERP